uniref:Amidase domain-containing protein n=1 Tax=Ditylenchus dipsaci TaxID=166011 RepID=A0A915DU38_9BILA
MTVDIHLRLERNVLFVDHIRPKFLIELVNIDLNAVVHDCFESAVEEAQKIDEYVQNINKDSEEFLNLPQSKPLLGVPFLSKDNLRTKGLVCIAGHPKLVNDPPSGKDAEAVHRLREAGAILCAKTPGGSSGGVGALVSSAASIFGLGNDLGGSVRIPAFMCGIFGLKPTAGIVPLDGMVPEVTSKSMQQLWTIGQYVVMLKTWTLFLDRHKMANNRLQLNRDVDFKKVKVFCMEELNILVHEPLQKELRQSVRNVAKYFEKTFNVDVVHINLPIAHHTFELWGAFKFGDDAPDSYGESIQKLSHCFNDSSDETILGSAVPSLSPWVEPQDGMPLGIQVVGPAYSEGLLIAVGKELEKGFGGWTPPGNI